MRVHLVEAQVQKAVDLAVRLGLREVPAVVRLMGSIMEPYTCPDRPEDLEVKEVLVALAGLVVRVALVDMEHPAWSSSTDQPFLRQEERCWRQTATVQQHGIDAER